MDPAKTVLSKALRGSGLKVVCGVFRRCIVSLRSYPLGCGGFGVGTVRRTEHRLAP